ncbi:COX15/CtaA family protein [Nitriliruptor alkaliphilus]|uniref:COX15/CtaA family protein n=1 Tax=Nitriliruptor alkaliphilus TaxID=427918 RepID=UPI000698DCBA|nr:COX15/CtaA family protein [Nitriliruptor alkaliphilus]
MAASSSRSGRDRLVTLAAAAIATNVLIVFTGGLVRVTGSGLGCPTWPTCDGDTVVPRPGGEHATWQTAVEFGNRLLTFVVLAVAVAVALEVRRRGRELPRPLRTLAWALPAGVLAQALLGGVTVLTGLSPLVVAAHFLLSMVLIAIAVSLWQRAREHAGLVAPVRADSETGRLVATGLRWATTALAVTAAVVLVLGTLVTAAGPHAGDPGTPRLGLDIRFIAIAHADAVWLLVGLTIALVAITWRHGPAELRAAVRALLVLELIQGTIGYVQYAIGIPAGLVAIHILGASLVWAAAVAVWIRARPPVVTDPPEQGAATPTDAAVT